MNIDQTHEITNVWHMLVTEGGGGTFEDSVADIQEYIDLLYDDLDTQFTNNQFADHLEVQNMTSEEVFGSIDWGTFTQGGNADQHTALGVCVFAWGRTRKPRVQIRKYFGVFTEGEAIDGVWQSSVLGAVNGSMAVHIDAQVLTGGLGLRGVAYNRDTGIHTFATSHVSSSEPAYQRRRKRGRGS
jgi:hypothetical protein